MIILKIYIKISTPYTLLNSKRKPGSIHVCTCILVKVLVIKDYSYEHAGFLFTYGNCEYIVFFFIHTICILIKLISLFRVSEINPLPM